MNNSPIVERAESLEGLALRINTEWGVAEQGQRQAITAYRGIGQALIDAKAMCGGHGKWLPWLKANVPFTPRHAQNYMRLAKCEVTSHLEDAWRTLLGNDEPDDEPEEETQPVEQPGDTEPVEEPEPDEDEMDADDIPFDIVKNSDTPIADAPPLVAPPSTNGLRDQPANGHVSDCAPSWFVPGNNSDPEHDYAKILATFTQLVKLINAQMRDPEDHDRIRTALMHVNQVKTKTQWVEHLSGSVKQGVETPRHIRFTGFQKIRDLLRTVGKRKRAMSQDQVLKCLADADPNAILDGDDE